LGGAQKTWGALPLNAPSCGYRPGPSNESGVHSYKSEVHCIVGSIRLFGLIEATT